MQWPERRFATKCSFAISCLRSPAGQKMTGTPLALPHALTCRARSAQLHQVRVNRGLIRASAGLSCSGPLYLGEVPNGA